MLYNIGCKISEFLATVDGEIYDIKVDKHLAIAVINWGTGNLLLLRLDTRLLNALQLSPIKLLNIFVCSKDNLLDIYASNGKGQII